jgi:acetyl esterase/lipase
VIGMMAMALLALLQGEALAETLAPDGSDAINGYVADPDATRCNYRGTHEPDAADVPYRPVSGVEVKLDQYDPSPNGSAAYPAVIMVHGGGWRNGCRRLVSELAWQLAQEAHYIVFAVDYRLACESHSDPEINRMCGWNANAAGADVTYAVGWVRANAGTYFSPFNHKVGILGFSAGGNLAYMAGASGNTSETYLDDTLPEAVVGWSGPTEMGYLENRQTKACTVANLDQVHACGEARNQYVNFIENDMMCVFHATDDDPTPGTPSSGCIAAFDNASPYTRAKNRLEAQDFRVSAAFLVNATNELTPDEEATQHRDLLLFWTIDVQRCLVQGTKHATGLKELSCKGNDGGGVVWARTKTFLDGYLW